MEKKEINKIEINEENPNILNDYLTCVRDQEKGCIERTSNALSDYIIGKVSVAINRLYENDSFLLESKMNEVTICGRLAIYLQEEFKDFRGYYVDIEYYRLKVPREDAIIKNDRIRCDILFHSRGAYSSRVDNLLAIEAKLEDNPDKGEKDLIRLEEFVSPITDETPKDAVHSTLVGLFLRFGLKKCTAMRIIPIDLNGDVDVNDNS